MVIALVLFSCGKEEEEDLPLQPYRKEGTISPVTFSGVAGTITSEGLKVQIGARASVSIGGTTRTLGLTGAGIREVTKLIVTVPVYVAAHYSDIKFSPSDPMSSVRQSRTLVLHLTLLRDVSAGQLKDAFLEAMQTNGINVSASPTLSKLVSDISFDVDKGTTVTFIGIRDGTTEELRVEGPVSNSYKAKGLVTTFWKLWFGTPVDEQAASLQKSLSGVHD